MRHLGIFSSLCLTATTALAAPPVDLLRTHAETRGYMLGRPVRPVPTPDGRAVLFLRGGARSPELRLYEFNTESGQTRELLTPAQLLRGADEKLSPEERARRERMRQTLRGFTWFELSKDGSFLLIALSGRLYTVDRKTLAVRELPGPKDPSLGGAIDPQLSPDGRRVAYVRDRDLYVVDLSSQEERRLTHSEHPAVSNGLAEFVAQEEMSRFSGFLWAPDSRHLVFEESDTRPVETFHIVDAAHPERSPATAPYPRPGKENARVRVGVLALDGGAGAAAPRWLRWDHDRFPYLATMRWSENAPLTLVVQSRDQRELEILAYDEDGKHGSAQHGGAPFLEPHRLLAERDDAWVPLRQEAPRWLKDGSGFLWISERAGGPQLELRGRDGALSRVLVNPDAGYRALVDIDDATGHVVFAAATDPTQRHLYRVPLGGGAPTPLTTAQGQHGAVFSKDHRTFVQSSSTPSALPVSLVQRLDAAGKPTLLGELSSVAERPPLLPNLELTTAGPKALRAALVRPRAFQPGRKYPVIVDVYGGPGHVHVTAEAARFLLHQWVADHGYIVVSADGRGTPGRGRDFERSLKGNFAKVTLADQVEALQALGQRYPELDLSRVGIKGWSFGGYMAALAVLKRPDVFHVGVAGAPVVDWHDYDTHYTERYLDLPAQNPAGYEDSSLLPLAPGLQRPLLIIHGTGDDNVYFFHALKLSDALFRAGKPHDFLPLSGLTHMVPDANVTIRLWERIMATLGNALKP